MITIEFIVPYEGFRVTAEKAIDDYPNKDEVGFVVSDVPYSQLRNHRFTGDVIIARGLASSFMNNLFLGSNIVLELPMTGYDVLRAIYSGLQTYKVKKAAIIATENVIYGIKNSDIPFPVQVSTYAISDLSNINTIVTNAIDDGNDFIVGGDSVVPVCKKRGIPFSRINVGAESIRQVIDDAINICNHSRNERLRVERFKALIENVDEGIIACDDTKKITICNNYVNKLFHEIPHSLIGTMISDLCQELDEPPLDTLNDPETGKMISISDTGFAVSRIPVRVDGKFVSGVLVFQELANIHKIESEFRRNAKKTSFVAKYKFTNILGESPLLAKAKDMAENYSKYDANVLIVGETGTGKELFAQSIHNASSRSNKPFVAVNCAALPASLLESELFGYASGSFTGASKEGKMGLFEMAHTGTIFLDEISEMSLELQGRLLRVIEQREVLRIGHDKVIPIDIRIIAATNRNIQELIAQNKFRHDLFYRLDVLRLDLPPLRATKEDIPKLMEHYISYYDEKHKTVPHMLDPSIFPFLMGLSWPGNTRELRNLCERLSTVVRGSIIGISDVHSCCGDINSEKREKMQSAIEIEEALRQFQGNKTKASHSLGIDRATLYRRMKKYKIT